MHQLIFRQAAPDDAKRCHEIELAGYSGDEAATLEKIKTRIHIYPEGFLVAENDQGIVGFINAGACHEVELSDENFKELIGHDPQGEHIVIMSVVVHPDFQSKGFAGLLMRRFIEDMRAMGKKDIYLICQTELIGFYEKYDFAYLRASDSDHGGLAWHDMRLSLNSNLP